MHSYDLQMMKKGVLNTARILLASSLLLAAVCGYVCYEKTQIKGWIPVAVSLTAALFTMPLLAARWRVFTGSDDRSVNRLCHLLAFGAAVYFAFMGGNYLLSNPASEYGEQITVLKKLRKERHRTYRSGRRVVRGKPYTVYYFDVSFQDGIRKRMQISASLFNTCRENAPKTVTMRRGLFGFPVLHHFGPPAGKPQGKPQDETARQ